MNLYTYAMKFTRDGSARVAELAAEAFERYKSSLNPRVTPVDPFTFLAVGDFSAFMWKPDDVVQQIAADGSAGWIGIVKGYAPINGGSLGHSLIWRVVVTTATGDVDMAADCLRMAEYPPGLVEIIRKRFGVDKDC